MENKKKKFRISGKLIFNLIVFAISIYLVIYFFVSEDGLIDLLSKPDSFNWGWILVAFLVYQSNTLIDALVTLIFIRSKYKNFSFLEALKVSFVGVFFSAITPSSTGGQPMQLYLMAKKNISVGFGSACMTQKFIVYQIVTTVFSVIAVLCKFEYFRSAFTNIWSTLFIIFGFLTQVGVTILFLIVSFSKGLTGKLINLIYKIMRKFRFIKNPEKKIERLKTEVESFHRGNTELMSNKKLLVSTYLLVCFQVFAILSVPYIIYIGFGMPEIAIANNQVPANLFDCVCIQSFVLFTSNLIPLPGASGGAELAFTMYFGQFFIIGGINKIKPAILLWRFVTYYGSIVVSAPFSYYTRGKNAEDLQLELEQKNKD
ncbi:MAG: lysylphosphatidylglycerol synthase transmembrane domain-containing protein [Ruminococcus sp.]|nr:lysylphosphatidylglycerol synthase transmembrane domain-containing protein [Ruminococcus sp.]